VVSSKKTASHPTIKKTSARTILYKAHDEDKPCKSARPSPYHEDPSRSAHQACGLSAVVLNPTAPNLRSPIDSAGKLTFNVLINSAPPKRIQCIAFWHQPPLRPRRDVIVPPLQGRHCPTWEVKSRCG